MLDEDNWYLIGLAHGYKYFISTIIYDYQKKRVPDTSRDD